MPGCARRSGCCPAAGWSIVPQVAAHQLSKTDARRIAVRAQMLAEPRPAELLGVVRQLTLLQADQTAAVAPSADLVLWSRLGSAYQPQELVAAIEEREVVELHGMLRPAEDIALYTAQMRDWPGRGELKDWEEYRRDWVHANRAAAQDILVRLRSEGPLPARDLPDTCAVPWSSSGWNNDRNRTLLLELLAQRGDVAVAGRRGRDRLWDLAERVYPDDPPVPAEAAQRIRDERRLKSLGIARQRAGATMAEAQSVGLAGEEAVIEGVKGVWRVDPAQLGQPFAGRAALLSPLDRLVFDRKRTMEIFDYDYQLEMYKPAAKRRWGYFALPILHGDRLVGKLDATSERKAGVLRVDALHEDVPFTKTMRAAVMRELEDLAGWLKLHLDLPRRS